MCDTCGCGGKPVGKGISIKAHSHTHSHGGVVHAHEHEHDHDHAHDQPHSRDHEHPSAAASRAVAVELKILARNDEQAAHNRGWLDARGITALNFISSPGAGKTLLLEKTLEALRGKVGAAVIVGDQQSDNDARRLSGKGAKVVQIETGHACHLEAQRVYQSFAEVVEPETKLLLIENVGNLICPAAFDLGEKFKVALLSVTEGEDKPVKYPVVFNGAAVVILTKIDLSQAVEWKRAEALANVKRVAPDARVFELSAKSGAGMAEWLEYLVSLG